MRVRGVHAVLRRHARGPAAGPGAGARQPERERGGGGQRALPALQTGRHRGHRPRRGDTER